jgi:hypothetical protein
MDHRASTRDSPRDRLARIRLLCLRVHSPAGQGFDRPGEPWRLPPPRSTILQAPANQRGDTATGGMAASAAWNARWVGEIRPEGSAYAGSAIQMEIAPSRAGQRARCGVGSLSKTRTHRPVVRSSKSALMLPLDALLLVAEGEAKMTRGPTGWRSGRRCRESNAGHTTQERRGIP